MGRGGAAGAAGGGDGKKGKKSKSSLIAGLQEIYEDALSCARPNPRATRPRRAPAGRAPGGPAAWRRSEGTVVAPGPPERWEVTWHPGVWGPGGGRRRAAPSKP